MPLVNKVVGMPLGANLDCDLRQHCGFVCEHVCVPCSARERESNTYRFKKLGKGHLLVGNETWLCGPAPTPPGAPGNHYRTKVGEAGVLTLPLSAYFLKQYMLTVPNSAHF